MSIRIYTEGPVCCSVCAPVDMTPEEVTARVNIERPTGITSTWAVSDEDFASGQTNPTPCNSEPETHRHFLLKC